MENNNYTIKNIPENDRPREKLIKHGAKSLTNSELLAIILRVGSKRDTAITLAQKILNLNGRGLRNIADISVEELISFHGISNAKAAQVLAVKELSKRISSIKAEDKIKINSPQDVSTLLMEEMRWLKKEYFKIILLDVKNKIIEIVNVSVGSLNSSIVHPREVFIEAIKKSSASMILVHNHPSGEIEPSKEDINITNRLIETGKIIGIKILDHIIIGNGEYLSFKERGII